MNELKRNRELLGLYQDLPASVGSFGSAVIKQSIEKGEKALASGDVVSMLKAYESLKSKK